MNNVTNTITNPNESYNDKNQNVEYFWDIKRQKYVMLMLDTQEVQVVDKEQIKRDFYAKEPLKWKFIKDSLFLDEKLIKSRYMAYEPFKAKEWNANGFIYQNTYIPTKIDFKAKKERSQGLKRLNNDLSFLKKFPHIEALLNNNLAKKEYLEYFINWLSYIFVTKKKTRNTILLRGVQGTGKGVIKDELIRFFLGDNNTMEIENDSIRSNFTPKGFEKTLFVVANEIKGNFTDGNTMYEKLKMYISDDTLRIEEKGIQAYSVTNHFNMIFFSNNDVPLQIQGSDRRYSIFQTNSRKLEDVATNDFEITIEQFIENIRKERESFLIELFCYNFNTEKACKCLETDEKERIYRASMTKIEILSDKCKSLDKEFFENDLCEILENMKREEKEELYKNQGILYYADINNKIDDLQTLKDLRKKMKEFAINHKGFLNSHLRFLYLLFVDKTVNETKLGTNLNVHFGKSYVKSINSNKSRIREVDEFNQAEFLKKLED